MENLQENACVLAKSARL